MDFIFFSKAFECDVMTKDAMSMSNDMLAKKNLCDKHPALRSFTGLVCVNPKGWLVGWERRTHRGGCPPHFSPGVVRLPGTHSRLPPSLRAVVFIVLTAHQLGKN